MAVFWNNILYIYNETSKLLKYMYGCEIIPPIRCLCQIFAKNISNVWRFIKGQICKKKFQNIKKNKENKKKMDESNETDYIFDRYNNF